jgi:hypothetical protein
MRVTSIDGSAIQNQAIVVSEAFLIPSFTVDSPFSPVGQMYVRGDGSAGDVSFALSKEFLISFLFRFISL